MNLKGNNRLLRVSKVVAGQFWSGAKVASALILGAVITGTALMPPGQATALTVFSDSYPNHGAQPHDVSQYMWWVDEDGNGIKYVTPSATDNDESVSSRGYYYRNCTDGVAYWIKQYTGHTLSGWGNANNWDNKAAALQRVIKAGNATDIEPGDIAQTDDYGFGHVGFVTEVTKSNGQVTSIKVAELNKDETGLPSETTYSAKDSSNKFIHGSGRWRTFIDMNGLSKGLNNEDLGAYQGPYSDGTFLQVNESGAIYRMVGGAPIRIYNQGALSDFTGTVTNITHAQLGGLPTSPTKSAFVSIPEAGGAMYRMVGGAPVRIYNQGALPDYNGTVYQINFQSLAEHDHMLTRPRDGTVMSIPEAGGAQYRFVGGAPIRIHTPGAIPHLPAVVHVNLQSLAEHDHMNTRPKDGSVISIAEAGGAGIYQFAGGAPLRQFNQGAIPDFGEAIGVNEQSLTTYDHMNTRPTNGTFLVAVETGIVYRTAGGAALRQYDHGSNPDFNSMPRTFVNLQTLTSYDHLNTVPTNGTVLKGVASGTYWQITNGIRTQVSATAGAVLVDDLTITDFPTS